MKIKEILSFLEEMAPLAYAEDFDNVGLLVGDSNNETAMHGAAYKHLPSVAQYLLNHGAKVEVFNRKNSHGWTPLRIAEGVHRGMNLHRSPAVSAVLRKAMSAAGVSTEVEPETNISGATR